MYGRNDLGLMKLTPCQLWHQTKRIKYYAEIVLKSLPIPEILFPLFTFKDGSSMKDLILLRLWNQDFRCYCIMKSNGDGNLNSLPPISHSNAGQIERLVRITKTNSTHRPCRYACAIKPEIIMKEAIIEQSQPASFFKTHPFQYSIENEFSVIISIQTLQAKPTIYQCSVIQRLSFN